MRNGWQTEGTDGFGKKKKYRLRGLQGLIGTHKAINYFITTSVFYSLVYKSFSLVHITAARLSRDNLESLYRNLTELQNLWLELFMVICFPKDHKLVWAQTSGFICMADCVEVNAQGPPRASAPADGASSGLTGAARV